MKYLVILLLVIQLHASSLKPDKAGHLVTGAILYATCYMFTSFDEKECLVPVIAAAVGKELYDMTGKGNPEVLDAVATVALPLVSYTIISW